MVVVADLVAKMRIDSSELEQGARRAREEVAAVGAEARATAAELDALSRKFAQSQGGSSGQWRSILGHQDLSSARVQEMMGASVQPAQRAAAAATQSGGLHISQAFAAMENARSSAEERSLNESRREQQRLHDRLMRERQGGGAASGGGGRGVDDWLSGATLLRAGGALLGVQLGLSLAAGAAARMHDAIAGSLEAERGLEVAARSVNAAYGQRLGGQFGSAAQAFTADPNTRGTRADFLQAAGGMRDLTAQYGLNTDQVQQAIQAAGQLAKIHGTDLAPAAKAVGDAIRGDTQALGQYGINLTDASGRIRGTGASYSELAEISGRGRASQVLLAASLAETAKQQANAKGSSDQLADSLDRMGRAASNAIDALGSMLGGPAGGAANLVASLLEAPEQGRIQNELRNRMLVQAGVGYRRNWAGGLDKIDVASGRGISSEEVDRRLAGVADDVSEAERDRASASIAVAHAGQAAAAAAETQTTSYERLRIAINRSLESIQRIRSEQGQLAIIQQALQGPGFPLAALMPGQAAQMGAAAAAQDIQALRARSLAQSTSGNNMRQQLQDALNGAREIGPGAVGRAQQDLAEFERRAAAHATAVDAEHAAAVANLHLANAQSDAQEIQLAQEQRSLEVAKETVGLKRVELESQQAVLEATRQTISARQAALPTEASMQELDYKQQMAIALARQKQGRIIRGQDVSGLPSWDELINASLGAELDRAELGPAALAAQQNVTRTGRAANAAQLAQQGAGLPLQQKDLEVALANLGFEPARIAAALAVLSAQGTALNAGRTARTADALVVNVPLQINANGTATLADDVVKSVVQQAADQVEKLLRQSISDSNQGPAPVSSDLVGARRGPR